MGRYVTVRFEGDGDRLSDVFAPLFGVEGFRPVAFGGVSDVGWLLSGYCLEDFAVRFSRGGVPSKDRIELAATVGQAERDYLEDLGGRLAAGVVRPADQSPFERLDESLGVTYVDDVALGAQALERLDAWAEGRDEPLVHCYGAISLAVADGQAAGASRSFRFVFPRELGLDVLGAPFLFARAQIRAGGRIEAAIHSESTVWLREGEALGGRVLPEHADANLDRLVGLARALKQGLGAAASADLHVEGSAFARESERLNEHFAGIAGPARRGW